MDAVKLTGVICLQSSSASSLITSAFDCKLSSVMVVFLLSFHASSYYRIRSTESMSVAGMVQVACVCVCVCPCAHSTVGFYKNRFVSIIMLFMPTVKL